MDGLRDPEVRLALLYVPAERRGAITALFALDARLAGVVERAREPMLAAIKLAWWRERIEALAGDGAVPDEPILQALPRNDARSVAAIVEAWETVLEGDLAGGHPARGSALFDAAARVLMPAPAAGFVAAGAVWALVDAARRGGATMAASRAVTMPRRWPVALRPLGMLAVVAAADARLAAPPRRGSPARAARMAWHRLTGR